MVFFQPPAAGGVVAPSSGRDVLKADPTGTGTAGLSRIVCTVTNRGSWVGDSGVRRLQQLPLRVNYISTIIRYELRLSTGILITRDILTGAR